jgi:hypothetical protein
MTSFLPSALLAVGLGLLQRRTASRDDGLPGMAERKTLTVLPESMPL